MFANGDTVPSPSEPENRPAPPNPASSGRKRSPAKIIAVAALLLLIAGLIWWRTRPPEAQVLEVKAGPVEITLSVVGRVRPEELVDVRSPNAGQIIKFFHDEGDFVAENAPLAVVRAQIQEAQTAAEAARETAARAEVTRARLAYDRTQKLAARGFATNAALEQAAATLKAAEATQSAAAATRAAAAARAQEFTLRAPMASTVLFRPIDSGQVIAPDTLVFQLGAAGAPELRAEADEAYADALKPGMAARAALTGTSKIFPARITEVSPRIDAVTGGRAIRLEPLSNMPLPPGRSVDITIIVANRASAILVPRQAILNASTDPSVYTLTSENTVEERPVKIADWPSTDAIITAGLTTGDRILLTPTDARPASKISPIKPR